MSFSRLPILGYHYISRLAPDPNPLYALPKHFDARVLRLKRCKQQGISTREQLQAASKGHAGGLVCAVDGQAEASNYEVFRVPAARDGFTHLGGVTRLRGSRAAKGRFLLPRSGAVLEHKEGSSGQNNVEGKKKERRCSPVLDGKQRGSRAQVAERWSKQ